MIKFSAPAARAGTASPPTQCFFAPRESVRLARAAGTPLSGCREGGRNLGPELRAWMTKHRNNQQEGGAESNSGKAPALPSSSLQFSARQDRAVSLPNPHVGEGQPAMPWVQITETELFTRRIV